MSMLAMKQLLDMKTLKYLCRLGKTSFNLLAVNSRCRYVLSTNWWEIWPWRFYSNIIRQGQSHTTIFNSRKDIHRYPSTTQDPFTCVSISSSLDDNQIYIIKQLKEQCEMYTKIINSIKIIRHQSWTAHNKIFKQRITYLLGVYSIYHKACNKLRSIFSHSSIASMGMNWNIPTFLRYGNHNYGSLNIFHIETE